MKSLFLKFVPVIIFIFQFQLVFSQYKAAEKISGIFIENNKKTVKDFFQLEEF